MTGVPVQVREVRGVRRVPVQVRRVPSSPLAPDVLDSGHSDRRFSVSFHSGPRTPGSTEKAYPVRLEGLYSRRVLPPDTPHRAEGRCPLLTGGVVIRRWRAP